MLMETDSWDEIRARVLERDGNRCTVGWLLGGRCSRHLHTHHIVPRDLGGTDDDDNLLTACARHHPMVEAIRNEIMRRRGWRRCPHAPGTHRYPGAKEACERRLNRSRQTATV